ncbi:hypothetical protein BDW22DRAFT_1404138 [Trametopsis cervina]|nr:hypothetical protein BDW22DRAFT_1404138 [Trametopsis cervina]
MSVQDAKDKPKKPRHRHSAWQLVALNELYERDEHPPLDARTSLAEKLGMEVKTVNAWFQNKRASSKKRSNRGGSSNNNNSNSTSNVVSASGSSRSTHNNAPSASAQVELPPISALIASVSAPSPHMDDYDSEDEHLPPFLDRAQHARQQSAFYAGNPQHQHMFEHESHAAAVAAARKGRSRPSAAQTEELRKLYDMNAHPSKEEREELGVRIGMRYQSVTNWFQNQRSIAKKRREDHDSGSPALDSVLDRHSSSRAHTYSPFPPSSSVAHPSLSVPPASRHPSLGLGLGFHPRARRSPSLATVGLDSRGSSPRPSPYSTAMTERSISSASTNARARRTRPEPYQLEALKKLFHRTATPSIEERGALALEINMDVGKVTNWFRNLRQSSRKQRSKVGSGGSGSEDEDDEDEDDMMSVSAYTHDFSRAGSPASMASDERHAMMDVVVDKRKLYTHHPANNSRSSDMASEEDAQEAVTPSPASSPYPAFPLAGKPAPAPQIRRDSSSSSTYALNGLSLADVMDRPMHTGVKVEDALLLLSFSHNVPR